MPVHSINLPFRLSLSSMDIEMLFLRCMQGTLSPLITVRIPQYLEDWLPCSSTREQAIQFTYSLLTYILKLSLTEEPPPPKVVGIVNCNHSGGCLNQQRHSLFSVKWARTLICRRSLSHKALAFLKWLLDNSKSLSTLKVYMAAISAHHSPMDGTLLEAHRLITGILKGASHLYLPCSYKSPACNLLLILLSIKTSPYQCTQNANLTGVM